MELFSNNGAQFSPCRKYRYALWRIWDNTKPLVMFVGLNPSDANEHNDDPTMRRVKRFAKDWGFGGVYMMNVFAIVSSKPEILKTCDDPFGDNDKWLTEMKDKCSAVVFAWGNNKVHGRDAKIIEMFPDGLALGYNKNGSPIHPLFVKADTAPIKFKQSK